MANTFVEALAASLAGDTRISGLVTGIWNDTLPDDPTAILPYATFVQADSKSIGILGGAKWVDHIQVNFEVRAVLAYIASSLAQQLRDYLMAPQGSISWAGGQECGRFLPGNESSELEEGRGIDGGDVWVHRVPVMFTTARG